MFLKIFLVNTYSFMVSAIEKLAMDLKVEDIGVINNVIKYSSLLDKIAKRIIGGAHNTSKLLKGKCIFLNKFVDNVEKLEYSKMLEKQDFYNNLNNNQNIPEDVSIYYHKVSC